MLTVEATGFLSDGTPFQLRHHGSEEDGVDTRIQIGLEHPRPKIDVPCRNTPIESKRN